VKKAARLLVVLVLLAASVTIIGAIHALAAPVAAPHVDSILPAQGIVGMPVRINGTNFGLPVPTSEVTFNGVPAIPSLWQDGLILAQVPDGATSGPVVVTTLAGSSNGAQFTVNDLPAPAQSWYLAEGSTAWGFETFILMENTTDIDATVNVTYNTAQYGRIPRTQPLNVPPGSRVTLRVNDDIPAVDVSTQLDSSQAIVCERAVYWNNRIEGTDSIGVTAPAKTWYLAEGCTQWPFETWICVQNPSRVADANVGITYMTSKGTVEKPMITVGAGQRKTIDVSKDVGECDVSARVVSDSDVVCERAMYWDSRRGGHDSVGVTAPSKTWYLAEGTTAWGFQTWLLLGNPNSAAARVDVTYMTSSGPVKRPPIIMPPGSRQTINVNDEVKDSDTSIEVASDKEVIAERSMYWDNGTGKAGHETVGFTAPASEIYLAEGSTAWGFETFVCVQNPNDDPAEVSVVYMTGDGPVVGATRTVPANSRITINVASELPDKDVSVKLTCAQPIMAERAMYWHNRGAGHVSVGWKK